MNFIRRFIQNWKLRRACRRWYAFDKEFAKEWSAFEVEDWPE